MIVKQIIIMKIIKIMKNRTWWYKKEKEKQ